MHSMVVDLRSPREWRRKIQLFTSSLESVLGGRLIMVVALPSPADTLYDSNVLVVLDELRPGDLEAVASLTPEGVSPLVVPEDDRQAVEAFSLAGGRRLWGRSDGGRVAEADRRPLLGGDTPGSQGEVQEA
ncbi:MAG: hypothetical protein QI223_06280 [Candidatus Korarchaeota archaeon]|nr:hypothetical protein [Candidatus Korarchaeota archaeon]